MDDLALLFFTLRTAILSRLLVKINLLARVMLAIHFYRAFMCIFTHCKPDFTYTV